MFLDIVKIPAFSQFHSDTKFFFPNLDLAYFWNSNEPIIQRLGLTFSFETYMFPFFYFVDFS